MNNFNTKRKRYRMNEYRFIKGGNAPDGIHESIEFNEYAPKGGWWKAREDEKVQSMTYAVAMLLVMVLFYLIMSTVSYTWG